MKAAVFVERGRIVLQDKPVPEFGPRDALLRVTTTTICGTDIHILKGEYPVAHGLTIGHEPGGVIAELGNAQCESCLSGHSSHGDHTIVTTLCPGGKEWMRRLMNVVAARRVDLKPLVTHRFSLEHIEQAYELFANQSDGVLKVAITP